MTEREDTEQPQRYCRNCGAKVRQGNNFCTSCGERLEPEAESLGTRHNEVEAADSPGHPIEPWVPIRNINRDDSESGPRIDYRQVFERIKNLPIPLKIAGAVVMTLLLLTVLSPVGMIIAALLLGVSIIALIIRIAQRRAIKGWGIIAVASLVLMFMFGGIASALYGGGLSADSGFR
jgi:hypothetical protein